MYVIRDVISIHMAVVDSLLCQISYYVLRSLINKRINEYTVNEQKNEFTDDLELFFFSSVFCKALGISFISAMP